MSTKVPVVVILFNRPDLIDGLFARISGYGPEKLYIIADGARPNRDGEAYLCSQTRTLALKSVTWPCNIVELFSDHNMGCRGRIVSGLDYVFEREEQVIILEDDTYPNRDFFTYCEYMLNAYSDDESIFSITGTNLFSFVCKSDRAFVSDFTHIWGWATWRRSWEKYDRNMECLGNGRMEAILNRKFGRSSRSMHWMDVFVRVKSGLIDTWDYQLQATAWVHSARCITPPRNLVSNMGFRRDASHTIGCSPFSELKVHEVKFPIVVGSVNKLYELLFGWVFHFPPVAVRLFTKCLLIIFKKNGNNC